MDRSQEDHKRKQRVFTAVSVSKSFFDANRYDAEYFNHLIDVKIPNIRLQRVTRFFYELDLLLRPSDRESLKHNEYAQDIFEIAISHAVNALSDLRFQYIAKVVKNAVYVDMDSYDLKKKILQLLETLSDKDIQVLLTIRDYGFKKTNFEYHPGPITSNYHSSLETRIDYNSRYVSWDMNINSLAKNGLLSLKKKVIDLNNMDAEHSMHLKNIASCRLTRMGELFTHAIR